MAFIIILPQILFPFLAGNEYKGINYGNYGVDDIGYYQKGKEILEGNRLGNPALHIGKNNTDPHRVYIDYILIKPLNLLGLGDNLNIVVLHIFITAIGVVVLIWLVAFLMEKFTGNRFFSIATACFLVGGYNLLLFAPIRSSPFSSLFNIYGRPTMPILSSVVFFIFLIFLYRAIANKKHVDMLIAGCVFGLMFYIYLFAWTFVLTTLGFLFFWYMFSRDWERFKIIIFIGLIGVFIGSYYLVQVYLSFDSVIGKQLSFIQSAKGRTFLPISKLSILSFVGLISVVWSMKKKRNKIPPEIPFLFSLALSGLVVINQQLITNMSVQPMHYFFYFVIPLSIIICFYSFFHILKALNKTRILRALVPIVLILAIFSSAREHVKATYDTFEMKMYAQQYGPIMEELKKDKDRGVVLISDEFLGHAVTIYTHHDLYWGDAYSYFTPVDYMKDAIFVYAYINTEARDNFKSFVSSGFENKKNDLPYNYEEALQGDIAAVTYPKVSAFYSGYEDGSFYNYLLGIGDKEAVAKKEEILNIFTNEYNLLVEDGEDKVLDLLKDNKVNYILWDKKQSPNWDLSFFPSLQEIASSGNIVLYKVDY